MKFRKYHQSTEKAHAEVLQNLIVPGCTPCHLVHDADAVHVVAVLNEPYGWAPMGLMPVTQTILLLPGTIQDPARRQTFDTRRPVRFAAGDALGSDTTVRGRLESSKFQVSMK